MAKENNDGGCGCGGGGIGIGTVIAAVLSWMKWHSIGWALFHALCGWAYVIYYLIRYGFKVG